MYLYILYLVIKINITNTIINYYYMYNIKVFFIICSGIKVSSCIDSYFYNCSNPLQNERNSMFKSEDSTVV